MYEVACQKTLQQLLRAALSYHGYTTVMCCTLVCHPPITLKLQRVQNTLARVVLRQGKQDHITQALVQLHWLPIRQRITFKVLRTRQPAYLYELIDNNVPVRYIRSSSQGLICIQ
jgi:hypothetical protein